MVAAIESDDDALLMTLTGQDDGAPKSDLSKLSINYETETDDGKPLKKGIGVSGTKVALYTHQKLRCVYFGVHLHGRYGMPKKGNLYRLLCKSRHLKEIFLIV